MKIRNLELKNRYFLAPMADMNDIAFRLLCKKAGAGLTYTGMLSPLTKEEIILDDKPAIQLFSNSAEGVSDFIKKYESRVSLFDFNLSCPAKLARKKGFGYFLQDLKIIEKILKEMRNSTDKPITIKLRKSKSTGKIVKIAEKYCDAICIHPRTAEQGYSGIPDLKFAERLKKKINIPVIYSGNADENNADKLLGKFDFVMIGRRALGNPNIFSKLTGSSEKFDFKDYLELARKYDLKFAQIKLQAMNFTKGKEKAVEMRRKLIKAKTIKEIEKIYGFELICSLNSKNIKNTKRQNIIKTKV